MTLSVYLQIHDRDRNGDEFRITSHIIQQRYPNSIIDVKKSCANKLWLIKTDRGSLLYCGQKTDVDAETASRGKCSVRLIGQAATSLSVGILSSFA